MDSIKTSNTMSANQPTKAYSMASIIALILGTLSYCIGLFNAEMALNEKGYYLIVLLYGLFSMVSLQKHIRDEKEGMKTSGIYSLLCWVSSVIAIGLLVIGLYNAELFLSEKGFYGMAYILSLFAAVTVQKNIRDSSLITESFPESDLNEEMIS